MSQYKLIGFRADVDIIDRLRILHKDNQPAAGEVKLSWWQREAMRRGVEDLEREFGGKE